jgi:hypothetical protein
MSVTHDLTSTDEVFGKRSVVVGQHPMDRSRCYVNRQGVADTKLSHHSLLHRVRPVPPSAT